MNPQIANRKSQIANRKSSIIYVALCAALWAATGCKQDLATDPTLSAPHLNDKNAAKPLPNPQEVSKDTLAAERKNRETADLEAIAAANREKHGHKMLLDKSTETGLTLQELRADLARRGLQANEAFRPFPNASGTMQASSGVGLYGGVVMSFNEFEAYSAAWTWGVGSPSCPFIQVNLTHQVWLRNVGEPYLAFSRFTSGIAEATSVADFTFPGFGAGRAIGIHSGFAACIAFEGFQSEYKLGIWD